MAAAIFLGFFVILGLGVVLVAMRGGPRGVRDTLEVGRKRPHARRIEFAVVGAIVLFGLAVPAVVLLGDQASAGPGGSTLTAEQKEGRVLFAEKCATCHTLEDANAVGRVGPDLDVLQPPQGADDQRDRGGSRRGQGPDARAGARGGRRQEGRGLHRRSRRSLAAAGRDARLRRSATSTRAGHARVVASRAPRQTRKLRAFRPQSP